MDFPDCPSASIRSIRCAYIHTNRAELDLLILR